MVDQLEKERQKALMDVKNILHERSNYKSTNKLFFDMVAAVVIFHMTFDLPISDEPTITTTSQCKLRADLIQEELNEYIEAAINGDLVGIADALGDILYVTCGAAITHGLDLEGIFWEIHRSNMTKIGGHKREDGKWMKPPSYEPPNLERFVKNENVNRG